jgi:tRNA threonylcarbamoyladenosine biosynthesis protein TsaE
MSSDLRFETASEEETRSLGRRLAHLLPECGVVLLCGELGAGKTTLAQGIIEGRGLALADDVASPTFTLIHEYGDPVRVYHIDFYRLDTAEQVRHIGLEEILDRPALVLIEWGDRFLELLPDSYMEIRIVVVNSDKRLIELKNLTL